MTQEQMVWEYRIEWFVPSENTNKTQELDFQQRTLNDMGFDGWELVSASVQRFNDIEEVTVLYLKRAKAIRITLR